MEGSALTVPTLSGDSEFITTHDRGIFQTNMSNNPTNPRQATIVKT
jgi:hypothetical protein